MGTLIDWVNEQPVSLAAETTIIESHQKRMIDNYKCFTAPPGLKYMYLSNNVKPYSSISISPLNIWLLKDLQEIT